MKTGHTGVVDALFEREFLERKTFEEGRGGPPDGFPKLPDLPLARATDRGFFELEQQYLWRHQWLYGCHRSQLPNRGDYVVLDLPVAPLVAVHGDDGAIRVFYNACRHRGAPVVRDARGSAQRLTCQFHSWSYDLRGNLVRVPDERDFVGLCAEERALVEVRCESWNGWIYVNLDQDAPPLVEHLGAVPGIYDEMDSAPLKMIKSTSTVLECNWKVVAEAFLEVYHLRTIHAETVAKSLDHRGVVIRLYRGGHSVMFTPLRMDDGTRAAMAQRTGIPAFDHTSDLWRTTNPACMMFPNVVCPFDRTGFPFLVYWPLDVRLTRLDLHWFGVDDGQLDTPERQAAWAKRFAGFDIVMDEDYANLAPIQRSLDAAAHGGVPLNYQERRIWHFHATLDKAIGPERIPEPLRVPDLLADWVE